MFKTFSLYLALLGISMSIVLVAVSAKSSYEPNYEITPAANPYERAIAASGIIEAVSENIKIGVPVSGVVQNLFVKVSDKVKKGAPLFEIDDRDLKARLDVLRAELSVAKASQNKSKDHLDRLEKISDQRAVSSEDLTSRKNDLAIAEAQVKSARAKLFEIERLIERLTVRSPQDGVILQSNLRVGEFVSQNVDAAAIVLGNIEKLQVRVDIDEQNASYFNPDAPAEAFPKNNTILRLPLYFERIEPFVIPKKSLTGAGDERVDTRVLQVIYTFKKPENFQVFVGQQVDVFIENTTVKQDKGTNNETNTTS